MNNYYVDFDVLLAFGFKYKESKIIIISKSETRNTSEVQKGT